MATVLFTMADVEMAHFNLSALLAGKSPNAVQSTAKSAVKAAKAPKISLRRGDTLKQAGKAGSTFLRRGKRGALFLVKKGLRTIARNPGKTALVAGGLAAAAGAGAYLSGRGRKKEDYSRQIRTVYFSRRYN